MMTWKKIVAIYASWMILHYISAHAYTYFCVPLTWKGILLSPFTVPTVHCTCLRWIIYTGGNKIISMWLLAGVYILGKVNNKNIDYEGRIG